MKKVTILAAFLVLSCLNLAAHTCCKQEHNKASKQTEQDTTKIDDEKKLAETTESIKKILSKIEKEVKKDAEKNSSTKTSATN